MKIDSKTVLYAVIGHPISHSLSPLMHNRAFETVGYNGVYLAFDVSHIGNTVAAIKTLGIRGVRVTIPHKISVIPFLDEVSEEADKIGAVNTVVNRNGRLYGYNTDCKGAVQALLEKTTVRGKTVTIIGAGGAARAIGYGLIGEGATVAIVNRTVEKGERLASDLNADFFPLGEYPSGRSQILINATPIGMSPHTGGMPVSRHDIETGMVVMDIVYNPLNTRLLQEAEKRGCDVIDGTGMFVHQGALQFELWTGQAAPVSDMTRTAREALGND